MILLLFLVFNLLLADKNDLEVRKMIFGSNLTAADEGQTKSDGDTNFAAILILWSLETPRIIHYDGRYFLRKIDLYSRYLTPWFPPPHWQRAYHFEPRLREF